MTTADAAIDRNLRPPLCSFRFSTSRSNSTQSYETKLETEGKLKSAVSTISILPEPLNQGDFKTKILLLLVACIGFSCTEHGNPLALISIPAGKVKVNSDAGECLAISWTCDTEVDSVWTVFYGSDYRFQAHGDSVLFSHYMDGTSKKQYWASETSTRLERVRSGFRSGDGTCGIWSEAIDNDSSVVRIYKGDVGHLYRDTSSARYVLSADDEDYPIAYVQADGDVNHRDFLSVHHRNDPRPADLVEIGDNPTRAYYLPVNFNAAALDTLTNIPQDDRPYLEDSICSGDECPEWTEPICPSDEEEVVVQDTSTPENSSATESSASQASTTTTTTATATDPEPITETETETEIVCSVTGDQIRAVTRFYSFELINGIYRGSSVEFNDYADDCWFPHSCNDGQVGGCVRMDRDPQPGPNSDIASYVHMWSCFDCQ